MRSMLIGFLLIVFTGCFSAEDISGKWYLIDSEETYDKTHYIIIDNDNEGLFYYQGLIAEGQIESFNNGWIFNSNQGDFKLAMTRSLDEFENGALSISQINEYGDILLGYFKKIDEE